MLSNLPPGCTNAMIEAQCGNDDEDACVWRSDCAVKAANMWDGDDPKELILDLFQRFEYDDDEAWEVIAALRGQLELRQLKKKRVNQIREDNDAKQDFM